MQIWRQSYCRCSEWPPWAATQALKHVVSSPLPCWMLMCSCSSSSQRVCRTTSHSSIVLYFGCQWWSLRGPAVTLSISKSASSSHHQQTSSSESHKQTSSSESHKQTSSSESHKQITVLGTQRNEGCRGWNSMILSLFTYISTKPVGEVYTLSFNSCVKTASRNLHTLQKYQWKSQRGGGGRGHNCLLYTSPSPRD